MSDEAAVQDPPKTDASVVTETPPAPPGAGAADNPDPIAEAKAAAETARAEAAAAQAERDAAKAEAEVLRRTLANPPAPTATATPTPPILTDEQKQKIEEKYGMPYDKIEQFGSLVQEVVSRETAPLVRERLLTSLRERHGATFLAHEKAFRDAMASVPSNVKLDDKQADDLFTYVYGQESMKAAAKPSAAGASPAGARRQIVGGTGLEGTQAETQPTAPASQTKLTEEEKFVARKMGLSEAEYLESKARNATR